MSDSDDILELAQKPFLGIKETAKIVGVSDHTLKVEIRAGRLHVLRLGTRGRRIVISKIARERWADSFSRPWESDGL
jgi:predicted DNA-binding protein (UPF0251 family)